MLVTEVKMILLLAGYEDVTCPPYNGEFGRCQYIKSGIATIELLRTFDAFNYGSIHYVNKGGSNINNIAHLLKVINYAET